ncbi:MAG: hypothetical protein IJA13_00235, partial [Clostridia bacterium]|nr:hypothetical protein [Clostridia bacterium]
INRNNNTINNTEIILDDMSSDELQELIEQIDKTGKTEEPVYYNNRIMPWDYRWFNLDRVSSQTRTAF